MRDQPLETAPATPPDRLFRVVVVLRPAASPDGRVTVGGDVAAPYEAVARGRFMAIAFRQHPRHDLVAIESAEVAPEGGTDV